MISSSLERLHAVVPEGALLLDVGGWGKPLRRADVVIDQMPYATRGLYGFDGDGPERFDERTWVEWDICERRPWPFADAAFDFVVCSQTLEDLRDPVWVCSELVRVARAGYVEVPSRLEEQSYGVQGPWVGWGHHHWFVDVSPGGIEFVFKHHVVHGRPGASFPSGFAAALTEEERVSQLWWTGSFTYGERVLGDADGVDGYLDGFVAAELARRAWSPATPVVRGPASVWRRAGGRVRQAARRRSLAARA